MAESFPNEDGVYNETVQSCGYYFQPTDGNITLMSGYALDKQGKMLEVLSGRMLNLRDPETQEPLVPNASINFQNVRNPIFDFIMAFTDNGPAGAFTNTTPIVNECVVKLCAHTINSAIVGSILSENITNEHDMESQQYANPWMDKIHYSPNYTLTLPDSNGQPETFSVHNATARYIYQVYDYFIPGTFTAPDPESAITLKYTFRNGPYTKTMVPGLNPWTSEEAAIQIGKITQAMSTTMRRQAAGNATTIETVEGVAFDQRVFVHIKWSWIALPGALLLFSLIFLIATVVKASKDDPKIGVWKTSALAVLFNGLGDDVQNVVGSSTRLGNARQTAKQLTVHLENDP